MLKNAWLMPLVLSVAVLAPTLARAETPPAAQNWLDAFGRRVSFKTPQGHFDISYVAKSSLPSGPMLATPLLDADYQGRSSWPAGLRVRPAVYDPHHPAYVQDLGAFLETALSRIRAMGFDVPGDFAGTVRVLDLGTKDGETSWWDGTITVDNDMKHSSDTNVGQLLMRTAAHELFHALQVNAGWRSMPRWFKEASAAYVEYRVWEPELGPSTIKGYLDTGKRFPNTALEHSDEDSSYSASALLVYLQDSFPRRAPAPPTDFVAEMYQLGGSLAADWKATTDTDYIGYVASSVATRRGYAIQSGLLSSSPSSSGIAGMLSALWTGLLPSSSSSSGAVTMSALWQLFARAYFVEWDKWARPRTWFGTNAGLYDQMADRLDLRFAAEKEFATGWLPLTARLFVVDGENFLRQGSAEARRGATIVVRLESLDPSDGDKRFHPLLFVYCKNDAGKIVGAVTIDPASNTIVYPIGPNKPDPVTVEILGIKGPVGWAMGQISHRTRLYSYALLPPAEASYQLAPDRDKPGQQAFTLLWQPAKRLPDQVRTGLRYRVYPSDSATSRGPVIDVGWSTSRLDLTKDPTKRVFYHVVMADRDAHESPEVVVEVPPATAPMPVRGGKLEDAVKAALQTLGLQWKPFEMHGNDMVEPTSAGAYLMCASREQFGFVMAARCIFQFLAAPREEAPTVPRGQQPKGRTTADGWGFDVSMSAILQPEALTEFKRFYTDPEAQARIENGQILNTWATENLKLDPNKPLSASETAKALALFTGDKGPLRRYRGLLGYSMATDKPAPWHWTSSRTVKFAVVDQPAAALIANTAAFQQATDLAKRLGDKIDALRQASANWPPFGSAVALKAMRAASCEDAALSAWINRQPSPLVDPVIAAKTICPPVRIVAEPMREITVILDELLKAGLAEPSIPQREEALRPVS